ncbi:MAG: hypothetical protein ABI673_06795 [Novosphingobium sp.]
MTNSWTQSDRDQRKANVDSARKVQATAKPDALKLMAEWGARNLVKVTSPGRIESSVKGYVTHINAIAGQTPPQMSTILGLRATDLLHGAHVYRLRALPSAHQFEVRGFTTLPDGAAPPEGKVADESGYRAGWGAWQIELTAPIQAEFLGELQANQPFSLTALGKPANLSGEAWWHANEAKYPNSREINALRPAFAQKVYDFVAALRRAGAIVSIGSTLRNRVRAHLMLYSFQLARGDLNPRHVPPIDGCDIIWDHGDELASRSSAAQMRDLFGVVYQPSLRSLHITGEAVDMTISWQNNITVEDAFRRQHVIGGPGSGASSAALHAIGKSYGVIKLLSDAPHWSVNGH